jgi:YD repeat-containing protein
METESPIGAGQDYRAQMKEKVHYTKYNQYGKVSSLIADDQIPVVYLWSYRSQYPIAEIKGATYEQVRDALGGESAVNNQANSLYPNHTAINNLRTNPAFANAQISTYTYEPFVGMLTATDPRGVTTYYQYDETGKLIRSYIIENGTEKTIQKYDYHYKN